MAVTRMVELPFDKPQFGSTKGNSDHRVAMPGMNKDTLNAMPDYHYVNRGQTLTLVISRNGRGTAVTAVIS